MGGLATITLMFPAAVLIVLGVLLVRHSVEAMGGTTWVEEAPGGGAAFSFSLPVAPARTKRASTSS